MKPEAPPPLLPNRFVDQLVALSPEKRALLELRLAQRGARGIVGTSIPRRTIHNHLPLSCTQERLWFLDQFEPNSSLYNMFSVMRLQGVFHIEAFRHALAALIARHETLRTTFPVVDGTPRQAIAAEQPIDVTVIDLRSHTDTDCGDEATRLVTEVSQRPFDLAQGPLLRALLVQMGPEDHLLSLTMHHIVSDGWSRSVLFRELATLYDAFVSGRVETLPPLPIQYADYAVWQRQQLQGESFAHHLEYWKEHLAEAPPLLALPTDRPRPSLQTYRGTSQVFTVPPSLTPALKALSQHEEATLFMTLLAAFQVLLARYTGQDDMVVGSPIAGRTHVELEGLIGFFVNTLVFRTDLSNNPTFRELLRRVRETALNAYAHQAVPYEKLVDELHPQRSLSHAPLVQVLFGLQNIPPATFTVADVRSTDVTLDNTVAKFDLSLLVWDEEQGLRGEVEYNTDLFDHATIARMIGHYRTLLEGIVANPDQPVDTLPLLTSSERHQLLVEWNDTNWANPDDRCMHQLFEEQVARIPEAIAVTYEGQQLTYRELNARANQLAHYLQQRGVGPDVLVGLCVERSIEMAVGLLGVLKAGGAYVPLDPNYPPDRLAFMFEDASPQVLLIQTWLRDRFPVCSGHIVCLDSPLAGGSQDNTDNLLSEVTPDNLIYMIYTSGSTGRPKGALIEHRSVVNHSLAMARYFALGPHDRVVQGASLSFDIAVEEIFPTWLSGATVILRSPGPYSPGMEFLRWITDERITELNLPTAFWHEWVSELERSHQPLPPTLRLVVVGGEKAAAQTLAKWQRIAGAQVRWVNTYGPTETTVTTTVFEPLAPIPPTAYEQITEIPIGRPIANVQVYVLDRQLHPVPIGVPGELYIGGAGVGRGYHNRDDLNAEKFLHDPFSSDPQARMYRTNDMVRYLPDGSIEFLGRTDNQVKIRGFRVELAEIESVLGQHPLIREAVVLALDRSARNAATSSGTDKRLVAYVVTPPDTSMNELRAFVKQKVPEFMVPSVFVYLDALPLSPNGKVDRRALPTLEIEYQASEATFVAPQTKTERLLVSIWEEVLNRQPIGVRDNFFELGGHSLLAAQLISRVRTSFAVVLPLRSLFEAPTVAELATQIESLLWATQERSSGAIEGDQREIDLQTTFAFLSYLRTLKIEVRADGDRLKCNAPKAALTAVLQQEISEREAEILRFLQTAKTWAEPASSLIPLQPAGNRLPFFGVPGHNGDVFCFMPLTRHLGPGQPFYGLQPPGTDGKRAPLATVEELAAHFVNDIRKLQPEGPYLLGGYCLGGFTAFEIARQLQRDGHEVALLAMFGSRSPAAMTLAHWAHEEAELFMQRALNLTKALTRLAFQGEFHSLFDKVKQWRLEKEERAKVVSQHPHRPLVEQATVAAVRRYKPEMYAGRISLFLPNQRPAKLLYGRLLEWKRWTSQPCDIEFGPPDCMGDTMLREPYVRIFADLLRSRIDKIDGSKVVRDEAPSPAGRSSDPRMK